MCLRWGSCLISGLCLSASALATGTVSLMLESALAGRTVSPGASVDWTIKLSVSTGDSLGLAQITCDLVQDPLNPARFDIPAGIILSIPAALANLDRPAGFTNPGEACAPSSFVGLQRGPAGQMDLVQIGGAQNTSGIPMPPGTGMGESAVVVPAIGQDASPQVVLCGTFPAPAAEGLYTFRLQNGGANVLTTIGTPPEVSEVSPANVALAAASFSFTVAPPVCRGDMNCDGQVSLADINPFVLYLANPSAWQVTYLGCDPRTGDLNNDSDYPAFGDINPFVALLSSTALPINCDPAARTLRAETSLFTRPSVAYLTDGAGVTPFAENEPRTVPATVSTVSDGAFYRNEAEGVADLAPQCQNSRYMFALRQGGANRMYRSTDGETWLPITITSPPSWSTYWTYMFATAADSLLVIDTLSTPQKIYRSADDGSTWSPTLTLTPGTPVVTVVSWGFCQAPNGTMLVAEYAGPGVGTPYKVYRSVDDGQTWTVVHTDDTITHFHAVGYHAATNQWFVANGDGVKKRIQYSADDGLTWQAFHAQDSAFAQPVWFQDIGDASRIWLGADDASQVAYMDVLPSSPGYKEVVSVVASYNPRTSRNYTFLMFKHGSVTYACNMDSTANAAGHYPVFVASLDGINWVTIHEFRAPVAGLGYVMSGRQYAGFLGGKLHMTCQLTGESSFWPRLCHFAFSPPALSNTTGLLLEPGVHNYFNATQSGCEHVSGPPPTEWTKSSGTLVIDAASQHEGARSVHWYHDVGSVPMQAFRALSGDVADGRRIYFRCRVKGKARNLNGSWFDGWNRIDPDKLANFAVHSSRECNWIEHVGLPTAIADPTNLRYALGATTFTDGDGGYNADLWIDTIQAAEVPITTWQLGSQTTENDRAAERLVYSGLGLQADWTYACRLVLTNSPGDLDSCTDKLYLFTIRKGEDACNYASVYYDPADRRIKLVSWLYGVPGTPIATSPLVGSSRNLPLSIVLRHESGQLRLSVAAAQPMENVAPPTQASLAYADTWLAGDIAGSNLMPLVLIDHVTLPGVAAPDSVLNLPDFFDQLAAMAAAP